MMTIEQMTNEEGRPNLEILAEDFKTVQMNFVQNRDPGKWKCSFSITLVRDELGNESIETENNSSQTRTEPRKYKRKLVLDHNQLSLGMSLKSVAGGRS